MTGRRITLFTLLVLAALTCTVQASAQIRRGSKTFIRNGVMEKPDTLVQRSDTLTLHNDSLALLRPDSALLAEWQTLTGMALTPDSLGRLPLSDTLHLDSLRSSFLNTDSTSLARFDALRARLTTDTLNRRAAYGTDHAAHIDSMLLDSLVLPATPSESLVQRKRGFISDSMSLSKVCWISTVLPGFGQVYNKQYWKLPILYGLVGTGLTLFFLENKTYRPLKQEYDALLSQGNTRTWELNRVQTQMIRSNTRRQLYLGASIASYIYSLGDAAINYSTNDVSHVKKATTLACICPGAGQIYNKQYWKLPFVIGGFSALIYCIDWNNRGFQRFKRAYALKSTFDASTDPKVEFPNGSPDEFNGRYTTSFLKNLKDSYRRNRDLCIILTAGLYVLQIVDAHVDAHLSDYDISDDLSMTVEPMLDYAFSPSQGGNRPVFGFNVGFKF